MSWEDPELILTFVKSHFLLVGALTMLSGSALYVAPVCGAAENETRSVPLYPPTTSMYFAFTLPLPDATSADGLLESTTMPQAEKFKLVEP